MKLLYQLPLTNELALFMTENQLAQWAVDSGIFFLHRADYREFKQLNFIEDVAKLEDLMDRPEGR